MLSILDKVLSLGGWWKTGKTLSGAIMVLFYIVSARYPEALPLLLELAKMLGIPLAIGGMLHKGVKAEIQKQPVK